MLPYSDQAVLQLLAWHAMALRTVSGVLLASGKTHPCEMLLTQDNSWQFIGCGTKACGGD